MHRLTASLDQLNMLYYGTLGYPKADHETTTRPTEVRYHRKATRAILAPFKHASIHSARIEAHYVGAPSGVVESFPRDEPEKRPFEWPHVGPPVTIDLSQKDDTYTVVARLDLDALRIDDVVPDFDPFPFYGTKYHNWREYARFRGEHEHYWWPRLLGEIDESLEPRSRDGPRLTRPLRYDSRNGMFYPRGPWMPVPHANTDYAISAERSLAGKKRTTQGVLAALFATPLLQFRTMTVEYSLPTKADEPHVADP